MAPAAARPDDKEHLVAMEQFFRAHCIDDIVHIAEAEDPSKHYAVEVNVCLLETQFHETCVSLWRQPERFLPLLDEALHKVAATLTKRPKKYLHARVCHLPSLMVKESVSGLRSGDKGKLISMAATVTRAGGIMVRETNRKYVCSKCGDQVVVAGDISRRGALDVPSSCSSGDECRGGTMTALELEGASSECREYQEIRITEKEQNLEVGNIPRSIVVVLTDDLVDTVKPGDDVLITGVIHLRWNRNPSIDMRADIELQLVAEHVLSNNANKSFLRVTDESAQLFSRHWNTYSGKRQLEGRNIILKSVCSQVYGNYLLKLILVMSLVGGVEYKDRSGTRIRGESHLLLVGDPGTAKSRILRYAAELSPRSVLTTGIGSTSAGLTVTAVKADGEWMLDAGALVLADGGTCCIDEFDGIRTHDRGAIHEAMEQQTLSVAKAGLVCTLDTRCSVIAAVNPKNGRLATTIGVGENEKLSEESLPIKVGIAAPLLSRFDVILTLLDTHNAEWDIKLSNFIVNGYSDVDDSRIKSEGKSQGGRIKSEEEVAVERMNTQREAEWTKERLQQYLHYVKVNLQPVLSKSAQTLLTKYYQEERASAQRNAARTTVRLLQGLVRLAQAHARLMYRGTATALDAVFAIAAVESSAASQDIVGGIGAVHAPFPKDPMEDFTTYSQLLLNRLGLDESEIDLFSDDPEC